MDIQLVAVISVILVLLGTAVLAWLLRTVRRAHSELEQRVAGRTAELRETNAALTAEIAERERVTDALRKSEARYRAVVEDQDDMICRYLPDGTLTFVNGAYCRFRDKPAEELIGQSIFQFVPPDEHERIRRILSLLTVDNPVIVAEHRTVGPQGESWRQWTRRAIFDDQGRIVEIQAAGRDVTRQRLVEEAIREKEAHLRRVVENLPVMVDALDENGVFVIWNRECERVTGYSADEMVGNPDGVALLYPDPEYRRHMQELFAQIGGDYRDWEMTLSAKDGSERIIAWSNVSRLYPIPGWKMWAIGVDVTRRKQTEKALHDAHESLERRIAERTAELRVANEKLQGEMVERQRAETALRTSQAMLRLTIDALADSVHVIDRDMRITLHNQAFYQMNQELGLETRAIGRTPFDLFPFLSPTVRDEYQQVFAEGKVLITYDETHIGSLSIHTETRKIPVFEGDQVTHVATVMRDITEQKRAEEALRESEEKFRILVNSMNDVIFTLDSDQRHTGVYGQWVEQMGLTPDAFLGKTAREILGDAAASVHEQASTRALGGEHVVYEWSAPAGDEIRHYQTSLSPLRDADGRVTGLVGVGRDITDIRRVEEALRESQLRYDMATSAGRVGVWDWNLITGELYLDSSLKGILGYAEDEILDRADDWIGHVYPGDLQRLVEAAGQHRAGQTPSYEVEHRVIRRDKSVRWLLTRGTTVRDADNQAYRIVGTSTDITGRKQAEQEILALAIEKERSAILAGFVQDVSHEFANPLSVIKNSLYLALNTPDPARRARHLDVIGGQTYHVEKLVEGLLTMSRLDSGFPFRHDPVDLNRLLLAVVEHFETDVQQKRHTLITDLAELPSPSGDQNYLNLAFRHLVENAIQYTPPGGTITIRTAQRGEQALVEIIDTGVGIAPEHLDAIFQRFFRVERARTERGAGLGLPIARMIIEHHGGSMDVESTPGAGSTFRVFLPFGG